MSSDGFRFRRPLTLHAFYYYIDDRNLYVPRKVSHSYQVTQACRYPDNTVKRKTASFLIIPRYRDSSVGIATGYRLDGLGIGV
jgi:hypothetical protein